MGERDQYAEEFGRLEQRFLRIAQFGESDSDVGAATASGGKLLCLASEAGLLPIPIPSPRRPDRISGEHAGPYEVRWQAAVDAYSHAAPDLFTQPNPSCVVWERGESTGAESVAHGRMRKSDWRIRAENYATACRGFIAMLCKDNGWATIDPLSTYTPQQIERDLGVSGESRRKYAKHAGIVLQKHVRNARYTGGQRLAIFAAAADIGDPHVADKARLLLDQERTPDPKLTQDQK